MAMDDRKRLEVLYLLRWCNVCRIAETCSYLAAIHPAPYTSSRKIDQVLEAGRLKRVAKFHRIPETHIQR
jgi:hypothetical protein